MNHALPQLAASSYLNSAPLIWSFTRGSKQHEVVLTDPVPSKCADLLAQGEVEAALVPVIEYQRMEGVQLVPDVCVGSKEKVRSVVLVTKGDDLQQVRTIALDESSRTSATLVKVIFREYLSREPAWRSSAPDLNTMLAENDGALIIGDPGMTFARAGLHVWDLASLWRQHTGFGFIFAMWMIRDDAGASALAMDFKRACTEGLSRLDEIVAEYQQALSLSRPEIVEYLTENISFTPDESMLKGMRLYFELAHKHGLINAVKPLRFRKN